MEDSDSGMCIFGSREIDLAPPIIILRNLLSMSRNKSRFSTNSYCLHYSSITVLYATEVSAWDA